jgi:hypothetical protein
MSVPQFFMLTSFVIASFEDGHSNCRMPRPVMSDLLSSAKIFPAMVMFIHNHAFIYCCNQNHMLTGSELVSINGLPMSGIINNLFRLIPSDAGIESRKNWEINETFPFLYLLHYGPQEKFTVTYINPKGEKQRAKLNAEVLKNVTCPPPFTRPSRYLHLELKEEGIAVLTVKTFFDGFLQQAGEQFKGFLDSAFTAIRNNKTKKLIIDIRNNQGGNDENGALLYSYLVQKPFMYYASQETNTQKFQADDNHPNLKLQQPRSNSFDGKVFILANGGSFSASAEFSAVARSNRRALFIGEEVGGGYFGNTSGDETNITLPNSQISCRIPMVKYTSAVKKESNKGNSILPDFPLYPAVSDFIDHSDKMLTAAINIASSFH